MPINKIIKFFILGGILTLLEWVGFYLLNYRFHINYIFASITMFILISALGVIVYRHFIFKQQGILIRNEVILSYAINTLGIVLNSLILWVCVRFFHIEIMLGKVIASFIVAFYGFFARAAIIYKG